MRGYLQGHKDSKAATLLRAHPSLNIKITVITCILSNYQGSNFKAEKAFDKVEI